MNKFKRSSAIAASILILGLSAPAHAVITRAWVSSQGTDAAGCGAAVSSCRTFQYVHDSIISAGGEIDVLDSAGYGALNITKALTIVNTGGTAAVPSITIAAGASDSISLNGLSLDGFGTTTNGILLNSGGRLTISNCGVRNYANFGIFIQPSSGTAAVSISNSIVSGNGGYAIILDPTGSATVNSVITQTIISGSNYGILAYPGVTALIDNDTISGNSITGLYAFGGTIRLSRTAVTGNGTGVVIIGGSVASYGDNRINGNTTDLTGSLTSVSTR